MTSGSSMLAIIFTAAPQRLQIVMLADAAVAAPVPAPGAGSERPAAGDDLNLARMEKRAIEQALNEYRYNISRAARELGLTRAALYRRMEKHGL